MILTLFLSVLTCFKRSCVGNVITGIVVNTVYIPLEMNKFRFSWQVSMWVQLQIPKIEDGNNFGVAVQVSNWR